MPRQTKTWFTLPYLLQHTLSVLNREVEQASQATALEFPDKAKHHEIRSQVLQSCADQLQQVINLTEKADRRKYRGRKYYDRTH